MENVRESDNGVAASDAQHLAVPKVGDDDLNAEQALKTEHGRLEDANRLKWPKHLGKEYDANTESKINFKIGELRKQLDCIEFGSVKESDKLRVLRVSKTAYEKAKRQRRNWEVWSAFIDLLVRRLGLILPLTALPLVFVWEIGEQSLLTCALAGLIATITCYIWMVFWRFVEWLRYNTHTRLRDFLDQRLTGRLQHMKLPSQAELIQPISFLFWTGLLVVISTTLFDVLPGWLATDWLRSALLGASWVLLLSAAMWLLVAASVRIWWILLLRKINKAMPEANFIFGIVSVLGDLCSERSDDLVSEEKRIREAEEADEFREAKESRKARRARNAKVKEIQVLRIEYAERIDFVAATFEQGFPRFLRSRQAGLRQVAHRWAKQAGASARSQGLSLVLGDQPREVAGQLADVLRRLVFRVPFEEVHEETGEVKRSFWRVCGRWAAIVALLALSLLLAALAFPDLPSLLSEGAWTPLFELRKKLDSAGKLQPGFFTGAFALFGIAIKMISPGRPAT